MVESHVGNIRMPEDVMFQSGSEEKKAPVSDSWELQTQRCLAVYYLGPQETNRMCAGLMCAHQHFKALCVLTARQIAAVLCGVPT